MGRASEKFDRQLFTLKLSELSHQMQIKSISGKARVSSQKTGGSVLLNIVKGELALLPEWLEGVDRIAREVWQIQSEAVTPEFVRDILMPEAMTLIGAREGTVKSSVAAVASRMGMAEDPYPAQHHLAMELNRVKGQVSTRYEIEVRELEYKKELPGPRPRFADSPVATAQSYSWKNLQAKFIQLAREEQGRADLITKGPVLRRLDQLLRVSCNYKKHPEGWARGKPEQGLQCLLDTPPHGVWNYCSDGVSENFRERVRLCVAEAGRALPDCPKGTDAEDFWLHRLYGDLLENNSDQLFCASDEGGMIVSVCVASATFCARLERKALETNGAGSRAIVDAEGKQARLRTDEKATSNRDPAAGRLSSTVYSPIAARRMEAYLKANAIGQTDFASTAGTTDRTLRSFRRTGKVRRDIFDSIAKVMGTTREALLSPE
jgi:hypothetical protein